MLFIIKFAIVDLEKGNPNSITSIKSIVLKYPRSNKHVCTPYKHSLNPGAYKFECWGSKGEVLQTHTREDPLLYSIELIYNSAKKGYFNSYMNNV